MRRTFSFSIFVIIILISVRVAAQVDSTKQVGVNLLGDLNAQQDTVALLPNHMLITQRILWGRKGLMRGFNASKFTPERREKELKVRRTMLKLHQAIGILTLGGMVGQAIVGQKLYNGDRGLSDVHESLAIGVNTGYFVTAGLVLFAPPKILDERKGFSSIKLHKILAVLHFSGMLATNILAGVVEGNPSIRKWHRAAAFTAFGAYAASIIVLKF